MAFSLVYEVFPRSFNGAQAAMLLFCFHLMILSQMVKSAQHFVVDFVTGGRQLQHARANP
jgi:hypothetical protein